MSNEKLPDFSLAYAWEKSYLAVRGMATGIASLQARVGDAFTSSLCLLNRENVTPDIFRRVGEVRRRLTWIPATAGEGDVVATLAKMSDEEAISIAEEIVDIFDSIAKTYGRQKAARPRKSWFAWSTGKFISEPWMSAIGCGLNGSLQHHTAVTVKKDQGGPRTANHIVKTDTQSVEELSLGRVVSLSPFGKVQVRPRHDGSGSLIEDDDPIATLIR